MIEGWRLKLESEELDSLLAAVLKTVQHVANNLLQERALLLPLVCRVFLKAYGVHHADSIQSVNLEIDTGKSRVKFSSRWLLNQLILHLNPFMSFKCVHMRVGTILYRQGGNIMASLSLTLSETKSDYFYQEETSSAPDTDTINELLYNEIITQSTFCTNQFYIDEYLQSINPLLSQFIQSATKAHERYEHDLGNNAVSKHVKKVRQYFILCQLLYCTNPMKVPPIHNMLADIVEVCGGSRQLLRILNRLGCTSSPGTHDRFVTYHAEENRKKTVWDKLLKNVFTIASVDNFDILQSHSAVFCGDQNRSYHGTTIQLVQPSSNITVMATESQTLTSEYVDTNESGNILCSDNAAAYARPTNRFFSSPRPQYCRFRKKCPKLWGSDSKRRSYRYA